MAIGNPGGSAASRFRPRPLTPSVGLGRRNLLADDEQEPQQDAVEAAADEPEETQDSAQVETAAVEHHEDETPAGHANAQVGNDEPAAGKRRPGRPPGSRNRSATPTGASASTTDSPTEAVHSVSDARARLRVIEQEAKDLKRAYTTDLAALNETYASRMQPLEAEYGELQRMIASSTFAL